MHAKNVELKRKKRKLKAKTKVKLCALCLLFVVVATAVYYFKVVCPIVVQLSIEKVYSIATTSVSDVVGGVMSEQEIEYSDLVKIAYSQTGDVETIEVDSVVVNKMVKQITTALQNKFDNLSNAYIEIPIGAFSGVPFLFDFGPNTQVQLVAVGSAKTNLQSSFTSAGINQTLHRLNLLVSVNIGMVLPASTQTIRSDIEVMLCECIIVGKIPQIYLNGQLM